MKNTECFGERERKNDTSGGNYYCEKRKKNDTGRIKEIHSDHYLRCISYDKLDSSIRSNESIKDQMVSI